MTDITITEKNLFTLFSQAQTLKDKTIVFSEIQSHRKLLITTPIGEKILEEIYQFKITRDTYPSAKYILSKIDTTNLEVSSNLYKLTQTLSNPNPIVEVESEFEILLQSSIVHKAQTLLESITQERFNINSANIREFLEWVKVNISHLLNDLDPTNMVYQLGGKTFDKSIILDEYKESKETQNSSISVHISGYEGILNFNKSTFAVIAGYVGNGKSSIARRIAYKSAYTDNKKILLVNTEMPIKDIRAKFISLLARDSIPLLDSGIFQDNYPTANKIINGLLDENEEELMNKALDHLYATEGSITIFDMNRSGLTVFDHLIPFIQKQHAIEETYDMIIFDYFTNATLYKNPPRKAKMDLVNDAIVEFKKEITGSLGIPTIILAQVNRAGQAFFKDKGFFNLDALSNYNELERSSTDVFFIGHQEDNRFLFQPAKSRNTKLLPPITLVMDEYGEFSDGVYFSKQDENNISNEDDALRELLEQD